LDDKNAMGNIYQFQLLKPTFGFILASDPQNLVCCKFDITIQQKLKPWIPKHALDAFWISFKP